MFTTPAKLVTKGKKNLIYFVVVFFSFTFQFALCLMAVVALVSAAAKPDILTYSVDPYTGAYSAAYTVPYTAAYTAAYSAPYAAAYTAYSAYPYAPYTAYSAYSAYPYAASYLLRK